MVCLVGLVALVRHLEGRVGLMATVRIVEAKPAARGRG